MSRKLLLNKKSDDYKGPIIYNKVTGIDIKDSVTDDSYSLAPGESLYFDGFNGTIRFNGGNMPTFLGEDIGDGTYEYNILQRSIVDPSKETITTFRLNKQLVSWTSTWYDNLYWDDEEGCYIIEKNADFIRVDGTDKSIFKTIDSSFTVINTNGYPNSMDSSIRPYITSNWPVNSRDDAVSYSQRSIIGYGWTASDITCYMSFDSAQNEQTILNTFISNPLNATFPLHNSTNNGSLSTSGVSPKKGVIIEKTNLTKKIKLKQYDGGTIYSMIDSSGTLKGPITISIPMIETKYLPSTDIVSGTSVTPSVSDDSYVIDSDNIFFNGFTGTHSVKTLSGSGFDAFKGISLLGEYIEDGKYRYTINASSKDGTQTKEISFDLEYQLTGAGSDMTSIPLSKMYWNDEIGCYDIDLSDGYLRIAEVDDTYETWGYSGYTYFGFDTVDGYVSYGAGSSSACSVTTNWFNTSLAYMYGTRAVSYKNYTTSYLGISVAGKHDIQSLNDYLANSGYGPAEIIYRLKNVKTIHTNIKKKIKLPWFGEGTTYTMNKTSKYDVKLTPTIEIGISKKYNFRVEYKIMNGRNIFASSINGMVIRHDKPGYLLQVRGDNTLYYDTVNKQPVVKLLGNRQSDGQYEYNLKQIGKNGKEILNTFKIPYMLTFCSIESPTINPKPETSYESPTQQSILYWDMVSKSYKVEERTGYFYADSAYNDLDFAPYSYKNYNIGSGAWEFLVDSRANYNLSASSTPKVYSNYNISTFQYAYMGDQEAGVTFPILSGSSLITSSMGVMGIYTPSSEYESLDVYLKNNPLHLITMPYWGYTNSHTYIPIRDTNINKQISFKIPENHAVNGATYSVSNDDISSIIKIALPVTYLDVNLPEPNYELTAPLDCTGSQYVNTGLQLFDKAKDFTILLDYQHYCTGGTYVADGGTILHCRYESTSTSYRRCGLAVETGVAPYAHIRGATDYRSDGDILNTEKYRLDMFKLKDMDAILNLSLYRYRIVIVYKAGLPHRIIQVDENNILYDYPLYSSIPVFRAHTRPLYLGCQNSTSNSRSKYFAGRINECKVWDGVALDDGQILRAIGDGPYPKPNYSVTNHICSSSNRVNTGMKLFDIYKDFTIAINFNHSTTTSGTTGEVISLGCADSNIFRLRILYTKSTNSYTIEHSNSNLISYTNTLANDLKLQKDVNGNVCIFIVYSMGKPKAIIDYSTGEAVSLKLSEVVTPLSTSTFAVTLGYRQQNTSDTTKTTSTWDGTIHNCMIWNGRALNESQIDNVYKRLLVK